MKRSPSLPATLVLIALAPATRAAVQVGFVEHVLSTAADFATSIGAADLDGDLDLDLLATSAVDDRLRWLENDGASPPSFAEHVVSTTLDGAWHVIASDVDADGDLDLVTAARDAKSVSWWESDGGSPPGYVEHVVDAAADGAYSVVAVDLDGDGDLDLASASIVDDTVAWYESDGQPVPSFVKHVISSAVDFAASIAACDIDADGDVDLFSASFSDSTVAMYVNDGAADPIFTKIDISTNTNGARSVTCADIDGDGDFDLVACAFNNSILFWYENLGGSPPAFTRHLLFSGAPLARSVAAADVDGDGDMDVLLASGGDDSLRWFENDGAAFPAWTAHRILDDANNAYFVSAEDVDGDGDLDLLLASADDDTLRWLEQVPWLVERYCSSTANSTGAPALIDHAGTGSIAANDLTLLASPVPANKAGLFYFGPEELQVPFGEGFRCVGAGGTGILRFRIRFASPTGLLEHAVDNTTPPAAGNLAAGSTWKFQGWYRDPAGGASGFNTSDGLSIRFAP